MLSTPDNKPEFDVLQQNYTQNITHLVAGHLTTLCYNP